MDYDEDGKKDLIAGDTDGAVWFFRNVGTDGSPRLAEGEKIKTGSSELADKYSKIDFADWNNDGLKDLIIGHSKGEFLLYYNTGEKGAPAFGQPKVIKPQEGAFPSRPSPYLVDWNGDGKKDLLVGSEQGQVLFYPNMGDNEKPRFVSGSPLKSGGKEIKEGFRARIEVTDWNNDGKLDLLVGNYYYLPAADKKERGKSGGNLWVYLRR